MRWYIFIFGLIIFSGVKGQELPLFNQYFSDYTLVNPALTAVNNCYSVNIADNHQWLGIENAPNTQALYANGRFNPKRQDIKNYHGIGAMIARDENGPFREFNISGTYSFHLLISESRKTHLSFALSALLYQSSLDESGFNNYTNDPLVTGERISVWYPDFVLAAAVYNPSYFAGITIADFLTTMSGVFEPAENEISRTSFFLIAGYRFRKKHDLVLEPSVVYKLNGTFQNQADFNIKAIYKKVMFAGISYRHNLDDFPGATVNLIPAVGVAIKNLNINYAFGIGFNNLQGQSMGSHFLHLSWKFCKEEKGAVPCPDFK